MIIYIVGLSGSGKSTVGEYIRDKWGFQEIVIGDELKKFTFRMMKLFGVVDENMSIECLYDVNVKDKYRKYVREIGGICREMWGEDFWCEKAERDDLDFEKDIVISDVHYENEIEYFSGSDTMGRLVLRIVRNCEKNSKHDHESEKQNIKADYVIVNDGSIENLYKKVEEIMCKVKNVQKKDDIDDVVHKEQVVEENTKKNDKETVHKEQIIEENNVSKQQIVNVEPTPIVKSTSTWKCISDESVINNLRTIIKEQGIDVNNISKQDIIDAYNKRFLSIDNDILSRCLRKIIDKIPVKNIPSNVVSKEQTPAKQPENTIIKDASKVQTSEITKNIPKEQTSTPSISDIESLITSTIAKQFQSLNIQPQNIMQQQINQRSSIYNSTISSTHKGYVGEESIVELFKTIYPKFEIIRVSATGHLADIHVIDHKYKIKFIVEVKLKENITKEDVVKYYKDVESIKENEDNYYIIGLFLSINSDTIISVGQYKVSFDHVFLTREFINENTMRLLIDTIRLHVHNMTQPNNIPQQTQKVEYIIPQMVTNLLFNLKRQIVQCRNDRDIYDNIKNNANQIITNLYELYNSLNIREDIIQMINSELKDVNSSVDDTIKNKEKDAFREYIRTHPKTKIKKADLLKQFPGMQTEIGSMKLDDLIAKYK